MITVLILGKKDLWEEILSSGAYKEGFLSFKTKNYCFIFKGGGEGAGVFRKTPVYAPDCVFFYKS